MKTKTVAAVLMTGVCLSMTGGSPARSTKQKLTDRSNAVNVFLDGTQANDRQLPSTASAQDPAASIAELDVADGSQVILASLVVGTNPANFSGIVTCLLDPPNGPTAKAEYIFIGSSATNGPNVHTLETHTTNVGPGTVDLRCTDSASFSDATYRFLQLTAIEVPKLTRTDLNTP